MGATGCCCKDCQALASGLSSSYGSEFGCFVRIRKRSRPRHRPRTMGLIKHLSKPAKGDESMLRAEGACDPPETPVRVELEAPL